MQLGLGEVIVAVVAPVALSLRNILEVHRVVVGMCGVFGVVQAEDLRLEMLQLVLGLEILRIPDSLVLVKFTP